MTTSRYKNVDVKYTGKGSAENGQHSFPVLRGVVIIQFVTVGISVFCFAVQKLVILIMYYAKCKLGDAIF